MVQLHELELHRPEQVLGLVQQPLVDVCVNGLLNTVQFYATTDSEVEVAISKPRARRGRAAWTPRPLPTSSTR